MSSLTKLAKSSIVIAGSGYCAYQGFDFLEGAVEFLPDKYMVREISQGFGGFLSGFLGNQVLQAVLPKSRPALAEAYSLASLVSFAHCDNEQRNISTEESLRALSKNIAQVIVTDGEDKSKAYVGSALLVTSNGYGITAHHVVEELKEPNAKAKVIVNGSSWRIDPSSIVYNEKTDIAVFKADIPSTFAKPLYAKISDSPLHVGEEVRVLGFRDGQQYNSLGTIVSTSINARTESNTRIADSFLTDVRAVPGQSGGVIVNTRGEIIGVPAYIVDNGHKVGHVGGAKIKYALGCIDTVVSTASKRFFAFKSHL